MRALGPWLSWSALGLLTAVVAARLMMYEEFVRHASRVIPGSRAAPIPPGPAAGAVLDLLGCIPALLVLLRRWVDRTFTLRRGLSMALMALLGSWAVASIFWASDRFAVAVSASHLICSFAIFWAAAQVVRSWLALRLVAGLGVGVLLVLLGQGIQYVGWERPVMAEDWNEHHAEILAVNNLEPNSYGAKQLEQKILNGEVLGFSQSTNTYAAVIVLTLVVTLGVGVERLRAMRPSVMVRGAVVVAGLMLLVVPAVWMIHESHSKTAFATLVMAIFGLIALKVFGSWLHAHSRFVYQAGVAFIVLGTAAVIGHGLHHGTLFQRSLTFRWHYWIGAARLVQLHPLLGVGLDNFGLNYLGVRLPMAPEEVNDPHNFVVRYFAELGIIGGALLLAWMLRLWWELTQSSVPGDKGMKASLPISKSFSSSAAQGESAQPAGNIALLAVVGAAVLSVAINTVAGLDFFVSGSYTASELFRRALFLLALVFGVGVAAARFAKQGPDAPGELELDDRPAPWIVWSILAGLGLFLLHNLVDFSMSEPGPLMLFSLLAGSALGMRLKDQPALTVSGRPIAVVTLLAGAAVWLAMATVFALPLVSAEGFAQTAVDAARRGRVGEAAEALENAYREMPLNGDYAARAAEAWTAAGNTNRAAAMYDAAIAAQPLLPMNSVGRAEFKLSLPTPDRSGARDDFERAVRLDPANVGLRRRFAEVLAVQLASPADAVREYELALWYDDQLPTDEPKRLAAAERADLQNRIESLRATGKLPPTQPPTTRRTSP